MATALLDITRKLKLCIFRSRSKKLIHEGEEEQKNGDSTSAVSTKHRTKEDKEEYKPCLRPRKIANYKDQFDISSAQSDAEPMVDTTSLYTYGTCVLPNDPYELKDIIESCSSEIKKLESHFFEDEHADSSNFYPLVIFQQ